MKYYFLGIGGVSMSALALLLKHNGNEVAGYDAVKSEITHKLEQQGINVNYIDDFSQMQGSDVVVVSSAISQEDKGVLYAKSLGLQLISRGELLGRISRKYENVIAVSGAHGKTTTTALIAKIFKTAKLNPTVHIGGILAEEKSNLVVGDKHFFITEACEYKDNFLYLNPTFGVVLNVEAEHLDYFKTFENVKKSFRQFISQSQNYIAPYEFSGKRSLFSFENYSEDIKGMQFDCFKNGEKYLTIKSNLHGKHNLQNILTAVEVSDFYGVDKQYIQQGLANFKGVQRRFEKYEFTNGSTLIFDYAHHPTEIKKVVTTVRNICKGKLVVVFQPHTYSRTKAFFSDFVECLKFADKAIIFKTYSARELFDMEGDAFRLYEVLKGEMSCQYSEDYHLLNAMNDLEKDDVVLVLGAGDFYDKCDLTIN